MTEQGSYLQFLLTFKKLSLNEARSSVVRIFLMSFSEEILN
jgi:hypothetical protein